MITLIPDRYKPEVVTSADLVIASVAWGFTLGIGWLTTWTAIRQTANAYRRRGWSMLSNAYVWMIWGEILVCLSFGIICFMNIMGVIPPRYVTPGTAHPSMDPADNNSTYSFAFFFCIRECLSVSASTCFNSGSCGYLIPVVANLLITSHPLGTSSMCFHVSTLPRKERVLTRIRSNSFFRLS